MTGIARPGGTSGATGGEVLRPELLAVPVDGVEQTLYSPDELVPRIRLGGLSVDGFGSLSNLTLPQLAAGMTIVLGPNEAGKSTIFDFVTAVLFGFPTRRSARFRVPVNGGRHGGRVSLLDASGDEWLIERHASPSKRSNVTRPDGSAGSEQELAQLLGHANGDLFRAVFAVDLDDLKRLDGMSSDEVREVLFSSSILGQRRSAARALKELEARREKLVRPRQGGEANALAVQLTSSQQMLADARAESSRFAALQAEGRRAEAEVVELRERRERVRSRARELDLLLQCWDVLSDRGALEQELDALPPLSRDDGAVLDAGEQIRTVARQLSGHLERTGRWRQLRDQAVSLTQSIESKVSELGGDWALEVAGAEDFEAEAIRVEIRPLLSKLAQARADAKAAAASAASVRARLAFMSEHGTEGASGRQSRDGDVVLDAADLPAEAALRSRMAGLTELRQRVVELGELEARARQAEELEESRRAAAVAAAAAESLSAATGGTSTGPGARAARVMTVFAVIATVALGAAAELLIARRQVVPGALLALLALAVVLSALWGRWMLRSPGAGSETSGIVAGSYTHAQQPATAEGAVTAAHRSQVPTSLARSRRDLELARTQALELLAELGLGQDPDHLSSPRVQRLIGEVEIQLDRRRTADTARERQLEAAQALDEALTAERGAADTLALVEQEIGDVARGSGLPDLEPQKVFAVLDRLDQLAERIRARRRIHEELPAAEAEIATFDSSVVRLARALGTGVAAAAPAPERSPEGVAEVQWGAGDLPLLEDHLQGLVSAMLARLGEVEERSSMRVDLERRLADAERALDRMLGHGEQSDALRLELWSGRILEWEAEKETSRRELDELESRYDDALRAHEGLQRDLDELARSTDVPALEQRCTELEGTLQELVRRYLLASGARYLLQRTLRRYEERRQPLVLERAVRHFTRVTDGRYVRLGVDAAGDTSKPTIRAIQSDGRAIDAADLSRGTTEQLYLSIRLGLAETFADRYVPLPIVLDDVLVNFDPVRQAAMARELAASSGTHQVIYLTCHPHVAELLEGVCEGIDCRVVELSSTSCSFPRIGPVEPGL